MSEWKEWIIEELVDVGSSKRIFYKEYVPIGIPFYRSKEIIEKHNGQVITTELQISINKYNDIKAKFSVPEEGDMLLTSVGTLGIPYIVQKDEKFYFKDGNLTWFRNFSNLFLNKYFYYWIISPTGKNELDMVSIGSTQPALTIRGLKGIGINLPPLPEQKAIASILSSLDDKIDLLHRQNKTLEAMAETLFRQCFVEEAQEEWEDGCLGDIASFHNGKKRPDDAIGGNNPIYGGNGIFGYSDKFNYEGTTIIIGRVGAYCGSIYIEHKPVWISDNALVAKPIKNKYSGFLYFFLKHLNLNEMAEGSSHPLLTQTLLKSIPILLPPAELIKFFISKVDVCLNKIDFNNNQIHTLEKLRDTLLPKLIRGEVRVEYEN